MRKHLLKLTANVLILSAVVSLTGCGSLFKKVEPIVIETKPVERVPLNLQPPVLEGLKVPQWTVITKNNAEEVLANEPALFGLNAEGYQDLANLIAAVRSQINEQRVIIKAYKDYYEPAKP